METGEGKPPHLLATMECQHLQTAFPMRAPDQLYLCDREGEEAGINTILDILRCRSWTEGRCQSLGWPD